MRRYFALRGEVIICPAHIRQSLFPMPLHSKKGQMMQNNKKAVSTALRTNDGATLYSENNRSNLGVSAHKNKRFTISEQTAALLSLCVELDMVMVGTEVESEELTDAMCEVRGIAGRMVSERIGWMLAQVGNICQEKITI